MNKIKNVNQTRKPMYNELLEKLKIKDKQIEDLLIGDGEMEEKEEEPKKNRLMIFKLKDTYELPQKMHTYHWKSITKSLRNTCSSLAIQACVQIKLIEFAKYPRKLIKK